ncbi:xanthine dehydrogenase/oxidase-like [Physella acuta]|uniref:xanthine dehydrogenase/oxidase-like n=1 Tax=Physella acuta TaxID=109671 RepID=UPI0027DB9BD7|nr:xanthine dehydrogenase/oxidase-like [Physella acuta]
MTLVSVNDLVIVNDLEGTTKEIFMDQSFFTGYKKTCLEETDTIVSVLIPYTTQAQHMYGYKQANRKEDDISIVNAGMWVELADNKIQEIRLAFGGMHSTTLFAIDTMTHLKGRAWDESILETAKEKLPGDLKLSPGAPGGMVAYRRTLTISFFQKFYLAVTDALLQQIDKTK